MTKFVVVSKKDDGKLRNTFIIASSQNDALYEFALKHNNKYLDTVVVVLPWDDFLGGFEDLRTFSDL